MKEIRTVPLLQSLNKVELAKLVPDLAEIELSAGGELAEEWRSSFVHFVVEGQLDLVGATPRPVLSWGAGDVVNTVDLPEGASEWTIRAGTEVKLLSLPAERFQQIVDTHRRVAQAYHAMMARRMSLLLQEFNRTNELLAGYAEELWREVPVSAHDTIAVSLSAEPEPMLRRVRVRRPKTVFPWNRIGAFAGTVIGVALATVGWSGGPDPANLTLGLLVVAAANWLAGVVPDFAVALSVAVASILFGIAKPSTALSGFISPTWFTLLAVWVIGVAVNKTGLLYRLALQMLRILPPTFIGQSLALGVTGFLTTPFLPSGQSRVVMVAPLVKELAEAMQFKRNSRGVAALGMTALIGFGLMYFMFLNGSTLPLLAYSLLPEAIRPQITWLFWLAAALPLGLFVFAGSYIGIGRLLPPERGRKLTNEVIVRQIRVLGPMSRAEGTTAAVLVVTLASFALSGFLGFEPAWVAMSGMLVLLTVGVIDRDSLRQSVDWGFLLFFGAVLSFAGVARANGVDVRVSDWIIPVFEMFRGSAWAFVAGVTAITFLVRLVIPAVQSVPLLLIALTPVATAVGVNPFVVSLIVLTMGTNFVIPQQSPFYMALHAGTDEAFTHRQIIPVAVMHAILMAVGLLGSVPYWRWLGLLP